MLCSYSTSLQRIIIRWPVYFLHLYEKVGLSVNFQKLNLKNSNFLNPGFSLRNPGIRASENLPGTREIEFELFPPVQP